MRSILSTVAATFLLLCLITSIASTTLAQSRESIQSSLTPPTFSLGSGSQSNPEPTSTNGSTSDDEGDGRDSADREGVFGEENSTAGEEDSRSKVEGKQVFYALMALTSDDPIDGGTAITILIVGSFVVYRISTFIVWLVTMTWPRLLPNPATIPAEKFLKREMAIHAPMRLYYLIAGLVALILQVAFCEIQLLGALGFETKYPMLDCVFTAGIMVVGAKRVAQWLDLPAIPGDPDQSKPVEVTGEVVLRDPANT